MEASCTIAVKKHSCGELLWLSLVASIVHHTRPPNGSTAGARCQSTRLHFPSNLSKLPNPEFGAGNHGSVAWCSSTWLLITYARACFPYISIRSPLLFFTAYSNQTRRRKQDKHRYKPHYVVGQDDECRPPHPRIPGYATHPIEPGWAYQN